MKFLKGVVIILYIIIALFDFLHLGNSGNIKFLTILIIFCMSITTHAATKIGLGITVICDYLLLFTDQYILGVFLFTIVQLLYIKIIHEKSSKVIYTLLIVNIFICFLSELNFSAIFYGLLLLSNFITALCKVFENSNMALISLGFLLFIFCDICVAFGNITSVSIFRDLIWMFYIPSQAILSQYKNNTTESSN